MDTQWHSGALKSIECCSRPLGSATDAEGKDTQRHPRVYRERVMNLFGYIMKSVLSVMLFWFQYIRACVQCDYCYIWTCAIHLKLQTCATVVKLVEAWCVITFVVAHV